MHTQTRPVVDDDTARHLKLARIVLKRASDQLEHGLDAAPELRARISEVHWLVLRARGAASVKDSPV